MDILGLLGGLALFLYGMQMMSSGLEATAGNKMKSILQKLTSNRFLGVIVGAAITAVIQSSSATTVMAVGFVNSGLMTLGQAVWIIMGANVGTTITGQLIALDVGALAPLFAFVGVAMVVFLKSPRVHNYGKILAGLGVLFIGMDMMSAAMLPLRESQTFISLMTKFSNPVLGILAGMVFTAVIQSSSASVGILQALASSGLIGLSSAVYVLFGQNIGTCITAVLACVGTSRNAKRTTIIHLMFNLIGTILFTIICIAFPLTSFVESLTPYNSAAQIANMHTLFNITTTLLLLPFGNCMVKIATRILPEKQEELESRQYMQYIKPLDAKREYRIGSSAIYLSQVWKELERMIGMVRKNVDLSFAVFQEQDAEKLEEIEETEEYVDYLNKEIAQYISKVMTREKNEKDSAVLGSYFTIAGNAERISDHAMNIGEYAKFLKENNIRFSEEAVCEIMQLNTACDKAFLLLQRNDIGTRDWMRQMNKIEQSLDDLTEEFRDKHVKRMKAGLCSEEACVIYSEMLTDSERIGDHLQNIGEELEKINQDEEIALQEA